MKTSIDFVERMLRETPYLQAIYDEHIADNGNLLPHVFVAEVTNHVVTEATDSSNPALVGQLLNIMESGLAEDPEVAELIGVSFVENLIGETEALAVLKPLMGPRLRAELERMS